MSTDYHVQETELADVRAEREVGYAPAKLVPVWFLHHGTDVSFAVRIPFKLGRSAGMYPVFPRAGVFPCP